MASAGRDSHVERIRARAAGVAQRRPRLSRDGTGRSENGRDAIRRPASRSSGDRLSVSAGTRAWRRAARAITNVSGMGGPSLHGNLAPPGRSTRSSSARRGRRRARRRGRCRLAARSLAVGERCLGRVARTTLRSSPRSAAHAMDRWWCRDRVDARTTMILGARRRAGHRGGFEVAARPKRNRSARDVMRERPTSCLTASRCRTQGSTWPPRWRARGRTARTSS